MLAISRALWKPQNGQRHAAPVNFAFKHHLSGRAHKAKRENGTKGNNYQGRGEFSRLFKRPDFDTKMCFAY